MGLGFFEAEVRTAGGALPISGARITVRNSNGVILYELTTDESGNTTIVEIEAPDVGHTLDPYDPGPYYTTIDVEIEHPDYEEVTVRGVQIFDTSTAILPVNMVPRGSGRTTLPSINDFTIPENALHSLEQRLQPGGETISQRVLRDVIIPDFITVHLGEPGSNARNVTVPFTDYIKNVASSEIFPTWPQASLEANIYAQISFALNRVYTEWYPVRGYNFNITNSTRFDQAFVEGRNFHSEIIPIVDRIFNQFIRRSGRREPFFSQYCNGTTATCPGLSQWGTVDLANRGFNPLQILRYYYPNDIEIVSSNLIEGITESFPGVVLREGDISRDVQTMQLFLNRIRQNFPAIPSINNVNGVFGSDTTAAVRTFQQQVANLSPTGAIDRATWNSISRFYSSVKRLGDLQSEGEFIGIGRTPPTTTIRQNSTGPLVTNLQYLLSFIGVFYDEIPPVSQDGIFGSNTRSAVIEFQRLFGLAPDGIVGPLTWAKLYEVYWNIEDNVPIPPDEPTPPTPNIPEYPGCLLRINSRGESVRLMQRYLNRISDVYTSIPKLSEDGIFGPITQSAVIAFQRQFGLSPDGIIGPITWNRIVEVYNNLGEPPTVLPPYPGYLIREGQRSENVRLIQRYLNVISNTLTSIPKLSEDGNFGPITRSAVTEFQRITGLSADGIVGPITWDALVQEYARLSSGRNMMQAMSTVLLSKLFFGI